MDIYTSHFGLSERPFTLVPDPDFLFWSDAHRRAFAMLEFGLLTRSPITLVTGEVGAGKTTLLQHLLRGLEDDLVVGLVSNALGDRGELLRWVLLALGEAPVPGATYVELFGQLQAFLIARYAEGRRVVLIFDEAQNLGADNLEELRMYTNINAGKDELLQIVLVGQPELRETLSRPELSQFAQRVASCYHLGTMGAPTVAAYIAHRLARAGARREIFSAAAAALVHEASGGVPRLVNQLCDRALTYAFAAGETQVSAALLRQVLEDGVFFLSGQPPRPPVVVAPAQWQKAD
ncbi:ExeA family protein [Limimaricola pyoseonensis]|uniref:Type II secretory pathway, component ExeA (Predicted ATPase) n=1 Tax=Limimaricola pyoseonensis TaxID=521013 RepID=A0A1G7IWX9_9RHOB|nr:AAA family ATPase [Limimaricola pyoseonensis]SDF17115.1 Type II secretory pathway, component ExeA (predicted ATPase) [Limimaricola pyoseonensis]